jgi:hypothetical protein
MIFILGWPKCGTSSLFSYLSSHPGIQGSTPKETFFLMDRGHPFYARHGYAYDHDGEAGFEALFDGPANGRVRLEATTHHVFQETARDAISRMRPAPHLLFILREPARRILSAFRYMRDNKALIDPSLTFDQYVRAMLANEPSTLATHYRSPKHLWIAQRELVWCDYARWLQQWKGCVPDDNMHILLFEDMKAAATEFAADLLARVGLNPDPLLNFDFAKANETYQVSRHALHRTVVSANLILPRCKMKAWLKRRYLTLQQRSATPENSYQTGLEQLRSYFESVDAVLTSHHGLDLRRWRLDD